MTVSNGQQANQTTFNNAFVSKSANDTKSGKLGLSNSDVSSGATTDNVQRDLASLGSFTGRSDGSAYNALPGWASSNRGTNTDNLFQRVGAIDTAFNASSGHAHTGASGDGPKISAAYLAHFNPYFAIRQVFSFTGVTGGSSDVSASLSTKTPGGGDATLGVATSAPRNRVEIRNTSNGDAYEDATGNKVYGRLTYSAGVWTMTYYSYDSGTESAYSFSGSNNVDFYFTEIFDQETRPTFDESVNDIGSLDATADVVDASGTQRGLVNTTSQTFAGAKTFLSTIAASNFTGSSSGANTGDVSLGSFGSSPNANGASLAGQVLTLQPASSTQPGGLTAAAQTLGGLKTFNDGFSNVKQTYFTSANDSSTGTNVDLSTPTTTAVRLTASITNLRSIVAPTLGQYLILKNASGAQMTVLNEAAAATAANRITTGTAADMVFAANSTILLYYDLTSARWLVIGGSGGGGTGSFTNTTFTGTTITLTTDGFRKFTYTGGSSQTFTAISGTPADGQVITIVGTSDVNTLSMDSNVTVGGWKLNGAIVFYQGTILQLQYDAQLTLWLEVSRNVY